VEIYPGFAADEVLYEDGAVAGVATKDAGVGKDGVRKDTFARGMELRARQTLFAEGCRGSCSEEVIAKFGLREGKDVQTYGIGMKEVGIVLNLLPPSIVFCTCCFRCTAAVCLVVLFLLGGIESGELVGLGNSGGQA
jgi:hypothetical protein